MFLGTKSYHLSTGREVRTRCARIGKIIRILGDHCKVDFFTERESGFWKKDGSGSDNVLLDDVIVIQPAVNTYIPAKKCWFYKLPENTINIVISYFEK